jgi:hypothetical protein
MVSKGKRLEKRPVMRAGLVALTRCVNLHALKKASMRFEQWVSAVAKAAHKGERGSE